MKKRRRKKLTAAARRRRRELARKAKRLARRRRRPRRPPRVPRTAPRRWRRGVVVVRRATRPRRPRGRPDGAREPRSNRGKRQRANRRAGQLARRAASASAFTRRQRAARRRERAERAAAKRHGQKVTARTRSLTFTVPAAAVGADPLTVQITITFHDTPEHLITAELTRAAVLYRLDHGFDVDGVTTAIVRWQNPTRLSPEDREWREGDQDAAWETLANPIREWANG